MHKPLSKQLNLDDRQTQQLQRELEGETWLYSDRFWKRAIAIYGYAVAGHLIILGPFLLFALLFGSAL